MTTYEGYNGQLSVEGEELLIIRDGLLARATFGKSATPRRIPLRAVSGVTLQEATRLKNGWLQLHLGGRVPSPLSMTTAPSDGDSVLFTYGKRAQWSDLYSWLQSVVERNRNLNVDPSSVSYDPSSAAQKQHAKQAKGEAAGLRPDVAAAASRMGWQFGGKREIKKLHEHLYEDENVEYIAQGTYNANQGIVVLTSARMLFLFHGLMSQALEDFPYRSLSSVQSKAGMVTGDLMVHAWGNSAVISQIVKQDLKFLADALRQKIASGAPPAPTASAVPAQPDLVDQIKKLAELREVGILTPDEFDAKKAELLARL